MEETLGSTNTSTKQQWIAEQARQHPERVFTSLHHLIDIDWMREAHRRTRKDAAAGVDGVMAADYETNLEANLECLLERMKSGSYVAPPVRRHYIPKADGRKRPLGIPTFEDKVAQRAILMLMEPIYEADFHPCSYGFRPGRSAHGALRDLRSGIMDDGQRWIIDADITNYFGSIDHGHLRAFLDLRIRDGVVRRMLDGWLKAGVMEGSTLHRPEAGAPQGGVLSPLLSNLYLHHVLDDWFEGTVRPRLQGSCRLVRFADDFVIAFSDRQSGQRVLEVLGKRLGRFGLALHPDKTRFVDFRRASLKRHGTSGTFDFLGFTHLWGRSRRGYNVVRQVTAQDRFHPRGEIRVRLVQAPSALALARSIRASRPRHPGPLQLLRPDRQRETPWRLPVRSHPRLAEMAGAPQSLRVADVGAHECTPAPTSPASGQGRALDLRLLSEPTV